MGHLLSTLISADHLAGCTTLNKAMNKGPNKAGLTACAAI
jgi:hypothetical protein